jgi:hypothetical protein
MALIKGNTGKAQLSQSIIRGTMVGVPADRRLTKSQERDRKRRIAEKRNPSIKTLEEIYGTSPRGFVNGR